MSRDITELDLRKLTEGYYVLSEDLHLQRMVGELVEKVIATDRFVIVKASTGTAQGVAAALDAADQTRVDDLRRLLGASNEPVLRRWTRVEAVLKADGRGLLIDPGAVCLRQGGAWIAGERAGYVVAEADGPPGYLISLAWFAEAASAASSGTAIRRTAGPTGVRWPARRGR